MGGQINDDELCVGQPGILPGWRLDLYVQGRTDDKVDYSGRRKALLLGVFHVVYSVRFLVYLA